MQAPPLWRQDILLHRPGGMLKLNAIQCPPNSPRLGRTVIHMGCHTKASHLSGLVWERHPIHQSSFPWKWSKAFKFASLVLQTLCVYIYIYVIIKYVSLILSFLGVFERLLHSFKSFTCSTQTRAGDTVRVRHTIRGHWAQQCIRTSAIKRRVPKGRSKQFCDTTLGWTDIGVWRSTNPPSVQHKS